MAVRVVGGIERNSDRLVIYALLACALIGAVAATVSGKPLLWAAALAPFCAFVAYRWPIVFPYGLYVLILPLDNVLGISRGEPAPTMTKFIGILSLIAILAYLARARRSLRVPGALWVLALLTGWMLLGSVWSIDQVITLQTFVTQLGLAALYAVLALTPLKSNQYRFLLYAVVASGLLAATIGTHMTPQAPPAYVDGHQIPIQVRLEMHYNDVSLDQNQFANSMLLPFIVLLYLGFRSRYVLVKLAAGAGAAYMLNALLKSGSREALIALAIMLVYLVIRSRFRLQVLAVAAAGAAYASVTSSSLWLRFSLAASTGGAGRESIWHVAMEALRHYWVSGSGLGTFETAYDQFYLKVYQAYSDGWTRPAHNVWLHYGVELGLVGLVLLIAFYVLQVQILRQVTAPQYRDLRVICEAALIGLLVISMFIDLFNSKYTWLIFAMIVQLRAVQLTEVPEARARAPLK